MRKIRGMTENLEELIREAERIQKGAGSSDFIRMYNKMLKALEKLEKIEERLEKIEKKIDWLIDYISFGLYQREIIIKPSTGTGEEKELIKYYKEPTTTDGR